MKDPDLSKAAIASGAAAVSAQPADVVSSLIYSDYVTAIRALTASRVRFSAIASELFRGILAGKAVEMWPGAENRHGPHIHCECAFHLPAVDNDKGDIMNRRWLIRSTFVLLVLLCLVSLGGMTMGWFDFLGRRKPATGEEQLVSKPAASEQQLVGVWFAPGAEIDIRADGTMDYIIIEPGKRQIMKLTYRVEGDEIVSNQPSAPREEHTKFWFENGRLVLMFGGERTSYQRSSR